MKVDGVGSGRGGGGGGDERGGGLRVVLNSLSEIE